MDTQGFAEMLKSKKLKITPQRIAILEELHNKGHLGIDEIFNGIKKNVPSVSLATVYKNILSLQETHIIKSIKTPTQRQKYEINKHPHIHLFCKKCEKIEDFSIDMSEFQAYCTKMSGYESLDEASIVLTGICPHCAMGA